MARFSIFKNSSFKTRSVCMPWRGVRISQGTLRGCSWSHKSWTAREEGRKDEVGRPEQTAFQCQMHLEGKQCLHFYNLDSYAAYILNWPSLHAFNLPFLNCYVSKPDLAIYTDISIQQALKIPSTPCPRVHCKEHWDKIKMAGHDLQRRLLSYVSRHVTVVALPL